jgi:hypothetical protein
MDWAEQKEIMAGMLEEQATIIRAAETADEAASAYLRTLMAGISMLGAPAEAIFSLISMPFGGMEGLQKMIGEGLG